MKTRETPWAKPTAAVPPHIVTKDEVAELRTSLANVLTLARIKWGNLDADANKVFEQAETLLGVR